MMHDPQNVKLLPKVLFRTEVYVMQLIHVLLLITFESRGFVFVLLLLSIIITVLSILLFSQSLRSITERTVYIALEYSDVPTNGRYSLLFDFEGSCI
jgi:hypothetical protein